MQLLTLGCKLDILTNKDGILAVEIRLVELLLPRVLNYVGIIIGHGIILFTENERNHIKMHAKPCMQSIVSILSY